MTIEGPFTVDVVRKLNELFDLLEELGLPKAVATSTRRSRAIPKLAAVDLVERLAAVNCGDEVARGKPAPDIFLAAAARALGAPPEGCPRRPCPTKPRRSGAPLAGAHEA